MDENLGSIGSEGKRDADHCVPHGKASLLGGAIAGVLSRPFPLILDLAEPLSAVSEPGSPWEWAVFSNSLPGRSLSATTRAMCKAVRAARKLDEPSYINDRFLTAHDLLAKSGAWPHTGGSWEEGLDFEQNGYISAVQRYRLFVCSRKEAVGFCTVSTTVTYFSGDAVPDLVVEIRAVFIDPAYRGRGLSSMLAEAAAVVALDMVRGLQDRLVASQIREMFDVELQVQGEIISDRGKRFLEEVAEWLERLMEASPVVSESGEAVFRVQMVGVYDVD